MANKYTKTPNPPKKDLESLYFIEFKSQLEISKIYNVSQKIVWRWFRDLKIKSRKPYKRFQRGENNHNWKGDKASYSAFHYRVYSLRGKANMCEECGRDDDKIVYDWANITGNYNNVYDYKMLCRSCHFKLDGHKNNLPNSKNPKLTNKRKLLNGK